MTLDPSTLLTDPAGWRAQWQRLGWNDRRALLGRLTDDQLRAHAAATGDPAPWTLGLDLWDGSRPPRLSCRVVEAEQTLALTAGVDFEAWLRPQVERAARAGCRLAGCMVSLPRIDQPRALARLLREVLPPLGWRPTTLLLNTVGYSDRGEPPDGSVTLRIAGELRWPVLAPRTPAFESTVAGLQPQDAAYWRRELAALAGELGLRLQQD